MRRFLLPIAALIALVCFSPRGARAQGFSSATSLCGSTAGSSSPTSSASCTNVGGCPPVGALVVWAVNGYQYTSATVTDPGSNSYTSASSAHVGTSAGYQNYFYYSLLTASSPCITYTANYSPSATFYSWEAYYWTGSAASSVLDGATSNTFTTNASTQTTTGTVTASGNDLLVSQIVCNSGNTAEFTLPSGWTSIPGSTVTSWHIAYKVVTPGTYSVTWSGSSGCSYGGGVYGTISLVAFKPGSTSSATQIGGMIVGPMKFTPRELRPRSMRPRKIPWDDRRQRKLELVRI